jgi:hypothetical protein
VTILVLVAEIKQRYHEKFRELDRERRKKEGKEDKMEDDNEGNGKINATHNSEDRIRLRGAREDEDEEIDPSIKFEYKLDKEDIGKPYHLKYKLADQGIKAFTN